MNPHYKTRILPATIAVALPLVFSACSTTPSHNAQAQSGDGLATGTENCTPKKEGLDPRDSGCQVYSPFRINYAGYLPLQEKIAVYITDQSEPVEWQLRNAGGEVVAQGISREQRTADFASGDDFYLIDFSDYQVQGDGYHLVVNGYRSAQFSISNNPYGDLKYEFYDYFQDHRRSGDVFDRYVDQWTDYKVSFDFIADAGDQGYYTVNAAEAQWSLINLLENYPDINDYYANNAEGMTYVYDELVYMNDPMDEVIFPGEKLAVAKFATFSNDTWGNCPGAGDYDIPEDAPEGYKGPCVSKPETKATYSVARTLGAMTRLHRKYGNEKLMQEEYKLAKTALKNAEEHPYVCLDWTAFGGEGGYYPNNDNYSLWRDPRSHRDPCAEGDADPKNNNVADDHYAAIVEVFLAARELGHEEDAEYYRKKMVNHEHHQRVDKFFFGAVSTEATLSLLTHRPEGIDLSEAEQNVFDYADQVIEHQAVGYPGVTFDVHSDEWKSGDNDDKDANWRWASNRMQLNDARIVMKAAEMAYEDGEYQKAADYTNAVLKVLDQMSGTNAVALAMYTSDDYPFVEYAVTRTHDRLVPDTEDGKMVLGPNNWTNSNDPYMPEFGSEPGMKMFTLTGIGWASREIAIDGNASIIPVVYFATEVAPKYLEAAEQAE